MPTELEVAKVIAEGLGYSWDTLYQDKSDYRSDWGARNDINTPMKVDYFDAAKAVITLFGSPATTGIAPKHTEIAEVLRDNVVAFTDCINDYAPEFCDETRVKEARARMSKNGTLSFFAEAIKKNSDALAALQRQEVPSERPENQ